MIKSLIRCLHPLMTFVATRGPTLSFLCALYRAEFSMDLHQICTKYSLDKIKTLIHFCHSLVTFVATRGPTLFFLCVLKPQIFHIDNKNRLDQDLDSNTFSSFISTREPGPKGRGWKLTYVAEMVMVVVWGYTVNTGAIEHY